MQSLDRKGTNRVLQTGLDQLKSSGRKIATLGFNMGGQESLLANLNDPDVVSATAIVYGFGFDLSTRGLILNCARSLER
jgi:dienelactone hydrolase